MCIWTLTDVATWRPIFCSFAPRVGGVLKLIVTAHRVLPVDDWCMTQVSNRQNLTRQVHIALVTFTYFVGIFKYFPFHQSTYVPGRFDRHWSSSVPNAKFFTDFALHKKMYTDECTITLLPCITVMQFSPKCSEIIWWHKNSKVWTMQEIFCSAVYT